MSNISRHVPLVAAFVIAVALLASTYFALINDQQQFSAITMFLFAATLPKILDFIGRREGGPLPAMSLMYISLDSRVSSSNSSTVNDPVEDRVSAPAVDNDGELNDSEWRPSRFLGSDNALALAQLRLSLERELRRISIEHKQVPSTSISRTWRNLTQREILPKDLEYPLRDVVSVCNAAVHGADIDDITAEAVVDDGEAILDLLRSVRSKEPV